MFLPYWPTSLQGQPSQLMNMLYLYPWPIGLRRLQEPWQERYSIQFPTHSTYIHKRASFPDCFFLTMPRTNKKQARESSPSNEACQVCTKLEAFEERYNIATKSNEEVLSTHSITFHCLNKLTPESLPVEAQIKNWTSSCYCHFKTPVIIIERGVVKYQFICRM